MNKIILNTERLILREMTASDYPALAAVLQDGEVMYAYAHAFSDAETQAWLDKNLTRYKTDGYGLWAVELKSDPSHCLIGQCGLTNQQTPEGTVIEIGYLFNRAYWKQGYAAEAARACKKYAFENYGIDAVYSIIRDTNTASINVALRNGMKQTGKFVKHYYGEDMPHLIFSIKREDYLRQATGDI